MKLKISKSDTLFYKGLEKLSDGLRKDVLEQRIFVRKAIIKALGSDENIANKSVHNFNYVKNEE